MDFVCDQQWDAMPDKGPGKFCHQCSKTLIDFTNLTDSEVFEYLKKPHVCGRISEAQLQRPLDLPFEHKISWWKKMAMGLGLLSMWGGQLLAFNRKTTTKIKIEKSLNSVNETGDKFPIKGKVSLENRSHDCSKIKISLEGTDIVGYTDSSGNFKLMIPDTLEFEPLKYHFFRADLMPLEYHLKQINKSDLVAVKMDVKVPVLLGKTSPPKDEKIVIKKKKLRKESHTINDAEFRVMVSKNEKLIQGVRIELILDDTLVIKDLSDSNGSCHFILRCPSPGINVEINAYLNNQLVGNAKRTITAGLNPSVEFDLTETRANMNYAGVIILRRCVECEDRIANFIDMNSNTQTIKNPIKNPVIRE